MVREGDLAVREGAESETCAEEEKTLAERVVDCW